MLQAGHFAADCFELAHRNFADAGRGQRLGFTGVFAGTHRVQAHQLAGQVEANHLLFAFGIDGHGLERTLAGHVKRTERLAGTEQRVTLVQRPARAHDLVELFEVASADAGRQAQHVQGTLRATAPQSVEIEHVCHHVSPWPAPFRRLPRSSA